MLTRDPDSFRNRAPHLAACPAIRLHRGDVRSFDFPRGEFTHVIHAATDTLASFYEREPLEMFDTIVRGTRRTLEFARSSGAGKFLLTSSGAVYGKQPTHTARLSEDHPGAPDPGSRDSVYGEGKRAAELLCGLYASQYGIETKIARCFAFVGPHLPLDAHFAVGNFIRDGLKGGPIRVNGDGTPYRSYLYAADLAVWLWTILVRGRASRPYNVGSESEISIGDLAELVAAVFGSGIQVRIAKPPAPGMPSTRYVPSTQRARSEMGLVQRVDLGESIRRTATWHLRTAIQ